MRLSTATGAPFVGRAEELARLARLLTSAGDGTPRTVVIWGEAGVGKSRLLREFTRQVKETGGQVLFGSCVALGIGVIPYAPLIDALRRLVRELGEEKVRDLAGSAYAGIAGLMSDFSDTAYDVAGPAEEPKSELRVFGAVYRLLERLGVDGPAVLVLEDLQWADPSTLDLVAYLARAQINERVLLACSYRSSGLHPRHPLRTLVAELDMARRVRRLEVSRFTRTEVRAFLRDATGAEVSYEVVDRIFDLSDGNAFFVEELVAAGFAAGAPGSVVRPVPTSLRDLLLARVELLGADARHVMRVAATAGRRVSHRLLATVVDLDERRLLEAVRECVEDQMLVTDPEDDTYVFRHALLREAVHQDLLPGERVRLHHDMATALTSDAGLSYAEDLTVAAELSYHWYEAGAFAEAVVTAVHAGDMAIRVRAFAEAERQYQRALELWSSFAAADAPSGVSRERVLTSAADAARWAGHVDRAVELVRKAVAEVDVAAGPGRAGELHERLGRYLWEAGDTGGSQQAYLKAGLLLADAPPSAAAARVLARRAFVEVRNARYVEALRLGEEGVTMARAVAAPVEEGRALNTLGVALTMTGRLDDGVAALRTALRIAEAADQLEDLYSAYGNLTYVLENAGHVEESAAVALDGLGHARRFGLEHTRGGAWLANNAAAILVLLGRWDEATELLIGVLTNRPVSESLYPPLTLAEIHVARGRFDDAEPLLATVRASARASREPQLIGSLYACLTEQAIWQRDQPAARAAVDEGLAVIGESEHLIGVLRLCALGLRVEVDEWLRLSMLPRTTDEERERTRSAIDMLTARAEKLGSPDDRSTLPDVEALTLLCSAERARASFDGQLRPEQWVAVGNSWLSLRRPYPTAYALWRAAESAAGQDKSGTTTWARTAHRIALSLGAGPLRQEIEALARRARVDLAEEAVPSPRPPVPADPFNLTRRERQVLSLLCEGYSNRMIAGTLFISDKTASVHVSNIMSKLGVSSRGEAAALANRLELLSNPVPGSLRKEQK